jgi:hypothetical protein
MNEMEKYNVILSPQIREGYEPGLVAQSFAELFKIPVEKAQSIVGTRKILKKDIEITKANTYLKKLKSIGLDVILEKVDETPARLEKPKPAKPKKTVLELVPTDAEQTYDSNPSPEGASKTIICPKCQLEQAKSDQCSGCGVFFQKVINQKPAEPSTPVRSQDPASPLQPAEDKTVSSVDSKRITPLLFPIIAALLGAILWKFIAVTFNYELGLIAWLIGGAIGFAAAIGGARGHNTAIACAILALLAIFGGKFLTASYFISEATAAVTTSTEFDGVDLKSMFNKTQKDAIQFSATVTDDKSLRQFMAQQGYSNSTHAESVTDEEVAWFKENEQPALEDALNNPQGFEEWKNSLNEDFQNISTFDVMIESLGLLDLLFLFLGVSTAYRLGMGNTE